MARLLVDTTPILPPLPIIPGIEIRHVGSLPGIAAGSDGTIWRCRLSDGMIFWRRLNHRSIINGYHNMTFRIKRPTETVKIRGVHTLVLEAFRGPCPPGMEACHFPDPDKSNNHLDNLRWDTRSENHHDAAIRSRFRRGEEIQKKLTNSDVIRIKKSIRSGMSGADLARMFGVTESVISRIRHGKLWAHLDG